MNVIERLALVTLEHADPALLDNWALDRVRAMGRRVVDADATVLPTLRAPSVGSTWTPTRGEALARRVFAVQEDKQSMRYELPSGSRHPCALSTWHGWVRRTRAVAS